MTESLPPGNAPDDSAGHTSRSFSKGGAILGLTAGLVGGSLAGLAFGVPGISSAASSGAPAPAAFVQQTDDTDVDVTDADAPEVDVPAEAGDRLRDVLQELVDDGTLTADQADAVTTHLVENRPERLGRRGGPIGRGGPLGRGGFERSEVLTDLLGVDAQTLKEELRSGSTLAEIAEANGIDTETLITTIVDQAEVRLDAAVEAERLTADEADERLAEFEAKVTERINGD